MNNDERNNPHLTEAMLQTYLTGHLPQDDWQIAETHLAGCAACRERVQKEEKLYASYHAVQTFLNQPSALPDAHLAPEQIAAFVNGDLDSIDYALAQSHFAHCQTCRAEQQDLNALQRSLQTPPPERLPARHAGRLPVAAVAALSALAATILVIVFLPRLQSGRFRDDSGVQIAALQGRLKQQQAVTLQIQERFTQAEQRRAADQARQAEQRREQQQRLLAQQSEASKWERKADGLARENAAMQQRLYVLARNTVPQKTNLSTGESGVGKPLTLRDGAGQVLVAGGSAVRMSAPLPDVVAQALKRQRPPEPPRQIAMLLASESHALRELRGSKQAAGFSLLAPVEIVSFSDRPRFAWSARSGATNYQIDIYDATTRRVVGSGPIAETSWTPAAPLPRGQTYRWQVTAYNGEDIVEAQPQPPDPMAALYVLDATTHDQIAQAQQTYAASPLTLGILYAQAGMLNEAENALKVFAAANPHSPLAQKLLEEVHTSRSVPNAKERIPKAH